MRGGVLMRPSALAGPVFREYMSKAWQDAVSHRLSLFMPDPTTGRVLAHWVSPCQMPAGVLIAGTR